MMINPPIGELLKKVDCRYTLAVEASKRARELIGGAMPLIDTKEIKPLSIAIEEINRGLITYSREEEKPAVSSYLQEEMEHARRYFSEHYNEAISIEDFAQSRGMSVSWFMRNFKQIAKVTPMQYILNIRINNAVTLLETTDYNVAEISAIVGYDNPLYFSRIFKKQRGVSPSDYRKMLEKR